MEILYIQDNNIIQYNFIEKNIYFLTNEQKIKLFNILMFKENSKLYRYVEKIFIVHKHDCVNLELEFLSKYIVQKIKIYDKVYTNKLDWSLNIADYFYV